MISKKKKKKISSKHTIQMSQITPSDFRLNSQFEQSVSQSFKVKL